MKRIAVLTSGGDAPGMNAAVRSVVSAGLHHGMTVLGVMGGYQGLLGGDMIELDASSVESVTRRGGTFLRTARCKEFYEADVRAEAAKRLKASGIEGLVVVGGDGSFKGADYLNALGMPCIGIPGTIDNDLGYTEFTLGFDSALNTTVAAANQLADTMESHERIGIMEVMGRHCGDLALYTGLAVGADAILVPEVKMSFKTLVERVRVCKQRGRRGVLIVVSEGIGVNSGPKLANRLQDAISATVRATVLGYVQRGGNPSARDLIMAARMGAMAVELLYGGIGGRVIGVDKERYFHMDMDEALSIKKRFSRKLLQLANDLAE